MRARQTSNMKRRQSCNTTMNKVDKRFSSRRRTIFLRHVKFCTMLDEQTKNSKYFQNKFAETVVVTIAYRAHLTELKAAQR